MQICVKVISKDNAQIFVGIDQRDILERGEVFAGSFCLDGSFHYFGLFFVQHRFIV